MVQWAVADAIDRHLLPYAVYYGTLPFGIHPRLSMGCGLSSGESFGSMPDQAFVNEIKYDQEQKASPLFPPGSDSVNETASPNMLRQRNESENKPPTLIGGTSVLLDTRANPVEDHNTRPSVPRGTLWEDPDFGEETAFIGLSDKVFYKRPKVSGRGIVLMDLCE